MALALRLYKPAIGGALHSEAMRLTVLHRESAAHCYECVSGVVPLESRPRSGLAFEADDQRVFQ